MGAVTTGFFSTQASATCAIGIPRASAICRTASTMGWSLSMSNRRPTGSTSNRRVCSPQGRASRPLAIGLYGMLPTPWSASRPNISRSSSRCSRLYWSCMEMNRVQPLAWAACCILANRQAHIDEAPMYRALRFDHVVQCLHGFFHRGLGVEAVDLVQVDPVGAQPPQRLLGLADDPAPRVAAPVGILAHRHVHPAGPHDILAPAAGQGLAHDGRGLADATRGAD